MRNPYLYSGMEARLYDQLDELSDFEDVAFYRLFAGLEAGPVLDLGCGTGRVLVPLVQDGLEVVGLDASQQMLATCRQKVEAAGLACELVQGDMRRFDLGERRFGTIMVPGFSIQMLSHEGDFWDCLACCRRHLRAGGQLILPTFMPWEMIWDERDEGPLELRREYEDPDSKMSFRAFQGWSLDRMEQRLTLFNRFEKRDAAGVALGCEERQMLLRWFLPHEMLNTLDQLGFSDVQLYGDFTTNPPEEDSESIVYVARG